MKMEEISEIAGKVNLEISLDLEEPRGDRNSKNNREEKERESFIDPNTR